MRSLASHGCDNLAAVLLSCGALVASGCLPSAPHPTVGADLAVATPSGTLDMTALGAIDAPNAKTARQLFNDAYALIKFSCGGCHSVPSGGVGPGFLASAYPDRDDPYPITSAWNNFVNLTTPELGQILTKGVHEGPALSDDQAAAVLAWLRTESAERLRQNPTQLRPQVKPFTVALKPAYNTVMLDQISPNFVGAYLRFQASFLPGGLGLLISDLRLFNVKPSAMTGEQRSLRMVHPLFIVWNGSNPVPDPVDNFAGTDKTVRLGQNDIDPVTKQEIPGAGNLIVPGILTLSSYRTGNALSVAFDSLTVVGPTVPPNPCNAAGLDLFTTKLVPTYLSKAKSCADATGMCHNNVTVAGSIDMSVTQMAGANLKPLCEQLKFYNNAGIIKNNTDPTKNYHPFRWTDDGGGTSGNCTINGLPNGCFNTFSALLDQWRSLDM